MSDPRLLVEIALREADHIGNTFSETARAILSALEAEGYKVLGREPTPEMIEAGLTVTARWHDLPGSQLQVNRQKMALRFGACFDAAPTWGKE